MAALGERDLVRDLDVAADAGTGLDCGRGQIGGVQIRGGRVHEVPAQRDRIPEDRGVLNRRAGVRIAGVRDDERRAGYGPLMAPAGRAGVVGREGISTEYGTLGDGADALARRRTVHLRQPGRDPPCPGEGPHCRADRPADGLRAVLTVAARRSAEADRDDQRRLGGAKGRDLGDLFRGTGGTELAQRRREPFLQRLVDILSAGSEHDRSALGGHPDDQRIDGLL